MSILFTIILCFCIIYIIHQLITYFRDNYTTKKTKDILGHQIKKYHHLLNEFQENNKKQQDEFMKQMQESSENSVKLTSDDLLSMNNELDDLISSEL